MNACCRLEVAIVTGAEGFVVVLCSWGRTVLCCGTAWPSSPAQLLSPSCSLDPPAQAGCRGSCSGSCILGNLKKAGNSRLEKEIKADLSGEQLQQPRPRRDRAGRMAGGLLPGLLFVLHAAAPLAAEQEVENLSGLSPNPEKDIFVVRENRTTCLMAEFAAKFIVPYDVWASNYVDLITEQADIPLSRGAEMKGKCGTNESELELSWLDQAYTLKLSFLKEGHNTSRGPEAFWRLSRIQFTYDSSERTYFKDAVSPGKYTASSHRLSALVTPAGRSYECQAQQIISLVSTDHQKSVQLLLSEVRLQPFDIPADFVFSEEHKCPVDQREQLEETLPLILGLILGLFIVITLGIYHIHHKLTASQVQIPRDRSQYKHMG